MPIRADVGIEAETEREEAVVIRRGQSWRCRIRRKLELVAAHLSEAVEEAV